MTTISNLSAASQSLRVVCLQLQIFNEQDVRRLALSAASCLLLFRFFVVGIFLAHLKIPRPVRRRSICSRSLVTLARSVAARQKMKLQIVPLRATMASQGLNILSSLIMATMFRTLSRVHKGPETALSDIFLAGCFLPIGPAGRCGESAD